MKTQSNHAQSMPPSSTGQATMDEGQQHATQVITVCPTVEDLKLKLASPSMLFVCPVKGCQAFSFKNQRSLTHHINAVHPQLNPYKVASDKEKREDYHFHCPQADCVYNSQLQQRWFSSLEHLRYHYINTHDEKRFACSNCGKRFGWKRDQEHHEHECGQTFACETCPAKYPCRRSLLTHCLRKQHPVPPQYEKSKQKVKDSHLVTSRQSVSVPLVNAAKVSIGSPGVLLPPGSTDDLPVSLTSTYTSVTLSSSGGLLSTVSTGVPPASFMSVSTSGMPLISLSVPQSSASSVDVTFSTPCMTLSSASAPAMSPQSQSSIISLNIPVSLPIATLKSLVSLPSPTSCPRLSLPSATSQPPVFLPNSASQPAVSLPSATSQPSLSLSNAASESPETLSNATSQHLVSLSSATSQPLVSLSSATSQSPVFLSKATSQPLVSLFSATTQPPVSLSSTTSQPPLSLSNATSQPPLSLSNATSQPPVSLSDATSQPLVSLSLSRSTSQPPVLVSPSESSKPSDVSGNSAPPTHTHHSVSDNTTWTHTRADKFCSEKSSSTTHTAAVSVGCRRKLRPILPKSQGIVVMGAGLPPSDSHLQPWVNRQKVGDAALLDDGHGVGAGCQTHVDRGHEGGGTGGVQVPVVHMGTQVSVGTHLPLPTCHRGTQMYVSRMLRGDSTHTAVQTCVQTAHSATQLAASLPDHSLKPQVSRTLVNMSTQMANPVLDQDVVPQESRTLVNMSTQMEERRQVCAVAIQTGGYMDVVNMAIQATTHQSDMAAQGGTVVVDVADLSDHHPKSGIAALSVDDPNVTVGTCVASQTSFPFVLLNKASTTNTTGTQAAAELAPEEAEVASTGMQTSVTLIHRPKLGVMVAQTQTCGDTMLPYTVAPTHVPEAGSLWPCSQSRASGGHSVRKRSTRSREVQTQPCSPQSPRRKKDRKKTADSTHATKEGCVVQELSLAIETVSQMSVQQTDTVSNKGNVHRNSRKSSRRHAQHNKNSCNTKKAVQRDNNISSLQTQQNPPLFLSSTKENHQDVWDPFLTSPTPVPSTTSPCELSHQLDELLSGYRAELGVQTPQDFLSSFTADFGMQTMDDVLSSTAELGVQTLDHSQERCTAELGVQTVTTVLGCLLENLDADLACGTLGEQVMDPTTSSMSAFLSTRETGPSSQLLTLDSQTQTSKATTALQGHGVGAQSVEQSVEFGMDFESSLPSPYAGTAPKLFDSFDSDLSFSDCGTGTEDFFASTHTQTAEAELTAEENSIHDGLLSFYSQSGGQNCVSHTYTPDIDVSELTSHRTQASMMNVFPATAIPSNHQKDFDNLTGEEEMTVNVYQSDSTCPSSRATSSCTTDTDLLSGVSAMDMHTQTADDLLHFLMNNMETQTTEDLSENKMAVADIHTQTTTSVLLTPPPPLSPMDGRPSTWLGVEEGLVSTETQTSSHVVWEMQHDQEDLFDLADMQTQTMLW